MPDVIYAMGVSLDGFIAGPGGEIDWTAPDPELHRFHNERVRQVGVQFCGRRLYQEMLVWERGELAGGGEPEREFAEIWQALPKVVFSTTLTRVEGNARLAAGGIAEEVATARAQADGDLEVGGAGLAASFIRLGLVDDFRLFVSPVVLGGGTPYFPPGARLDLELVETRTFGAGVVYLRYRRRG